jgi:hypothetical protein
VLDPYEGRSIVPKWQMTGTKHPCAVSETSEFLLSYLLGRGTLHGIDLCAPLLTVRVPLP